MAFSELFKFYDCRERQFYLPSAKQRNKLVWPGYQQVRCPIFKMMLKWVNGKFPCTITVRDILAFQYASWGICQSKSLNQLDNAAAKKSFFKNNGT